MTWEMNNFEIVWSYAWNEAAEKREGWANMAIFWPSPVQKGEPSPMPELGRNFGRKLVSWCFKPSQPQMTISGPKETFIKSYIAERTNKAEIRPKAQSCPENLWNEIQLKEPLRQNRHKNIIKRRGQARLVYVKNINCYIPTIWRWAHEDLQKAVLTKVHTCVLKSLWTLYKSVRLFK